MNNVLYTKATVFRNVKDYKFVPKLTQESKDEIVSKLTPHLKGFELINLSKADEKTIKFLKENYLYNQQVKNLFLNFNNGVCVNLFDGEHISITSTEQGVGINAFNKVKQVAEELANKISLSYADDYGYLMSDLTKIGSGVKLESEICLNSIEVLGKTEQVKQNLKKLGYNLTKTNQSSIYKLSTGCNLGVATTNVFEEYEKMLHQLQEIEIESAKMLDVQNHDAMLDSSLRSFAILNGSYLMDYEELNSHIINIITGLNLGYLNVETNKINALQKLSRDKNNDFISQTELKEIAKTVKEILKGE